MLTDAESPVATPQWIARMYHGKVGRDHLGLGSVSSDQILPSLSPAINVLTHHPRYFSFYTFLLDEFVRRGRRASAASWKEFYRPREFIFSVGAHLPGHRQSRPEHGDMGNVVGSLRTGPLAREGRPFYETNTHYIDSPLGGYGLYYRTVLAELALIYPGGPGMPYPVDIPTEAGLKVAAAFREAVKDTTYYRDYFDQDDAQVPLAVIHEYIDRACLCQLQHPATPDRPPLLDAFLHGGLQIAARARRATFRMFLDLAQQTDGLPLDQDAFRRLIYFRQAGNGLTYQPHSAVTDTFRRWRLYQAREYYSYALEAMWDYLCTWGLLNGGDLRPLPTEIFFDHLAAALDFDQLALALGVARPGLRASSGFVQLLEWLQSLAGASGPAFDAACGLEAPVHEHRLYQLAAGRRSDPAGMVTGMIAMLALLYLRFGLPERWLEPEWEIARMGANGRLPLHGFIQSLRRYLESGPVTILEIARWLYRDYIILQHQMIAATKMPDNTFRFRREGNRLQFYKLENSLGFRDSRFDALNTMVHELGLCGNLRLADHPLTGDGRQLLEDGDLDQPS